jgi:hypothetical protein
VARNEFVLEGGRGHVLNDTRGHGIQLAMVFSSQFSRLLLIWILCSSYASNQNGLGKDGLVDVTWKH